ncbi:MAG: hypothetical protein L6R38_009673 [Xanthoria sp. 2 TBL-2021]|nr:MAG: hypothetical protein L6R38_009673 [Xanthoria sp. 2 TBL-2021]
MGRLSYPADDVLDARDEFLSDDSLAEFQLVREMSQAAVQSSSDDTSDIDSHFRHSPTLDFPLPPPSFFTRCMNNLLAPPFCITLAIFFAPILIPTIAIYSSYRLLACLVDTLPLHPSTPNRFRQARTLAYIVTALAFLILFSGSSPTSWLNARDQFLLEFEDRITSSCGAAGRRLNRLNARPSTFTAGEPCVPSLCPNTLAFLQSPKNLYTVLGLPSPSHTFPPVSTAAIANASNELIKFYHPDRIHTHHLPPETSAFIFALIRGARKTLLNPKKREFWDNQYLTGAMGMDMRNERSKRQAMVENVDRWNWGFARDPYGAHQWDFYGDVDNANEWYNFRGAEGEEGKGIWKPVFKHQNKGDVWGFLRLLLLWWQWWYAFFGRLVSSVREGCMWMGDEIRDFW